MAGIFISYRRSDTGASCGRIADSLRAVFGASAVFRDLHDIPGGMDFRTSLNAALDRSAVVIVLIGPSWATTADTTGQRRLFDPNDVVRAEIQSALARNMRIFPVLVQGAGMPAVAELPADIANIHYLNAHVIHDDPHYAPDMDRLIQNIARIIPLLPTDQSRRQDQANVAYIEAQRFRKQATPVVKTIVTGGAILQIMFALLFAAGGIGAAVGAYGAAQFVSQILAMFQAAPDPATQGIGQSASGAFNAILLIVQVAGCGFFIVGLIWAITVIAALIRASRRRPV
ncbi:MAG TPA: toll/interleukin-1 receptor domain-containing protein [Ktedonobacterales bacterium]|jgi:hypothetical protein